MPALTPQTKPDTTKPVFHSTYQGIRQHTCEISHRPLPSLIPVRAVMPERVGIGCAAQCQNMPGNKRRWRQEGNSGRREEGTGGDAERWTHRGADSGRVSHFCQLGITSSCENQNRDNDGQKGKFISFSCYEVWRQKSWLNKGAP